MKKVNLLAALVLGATTLTACSVTTPKAPAEPVVLAGTSWMLQVPKESDCDAPPMLEFGDNWVAGDLGCNRARGGYTLEGNKLTFDDKMAVTRRMCSPKLMDRESKMLNAINKVRTVEKTDKGLVFYDEAGAELITLVPELSGSCN